jgi:uncharacterized protein
VQQSWLLPHTEVRDAGAPGLGVFVTADVAAGAVVAAFGGAVCDLRTFETLPADRQVHSLQVADGLFLVCPEVTEPPDYINHSCEPNCGISGNVLLVSLRDIAAGEQLTFDYAMCDSDPYDEFECACGTPSCRRKVTGNDWTVPELQERYRGHFSDYLARRITSERDRAGAGALP